MRRRIYRKDTSQRKALFRSLVASLISYGAIQTTEAKAKSIRGLVDRLVNEAKNGTLASRRIVEAFLQNKKAVNRLVDEIAPVLLGHQGGVTRITKIGLRRGDAAMMVKMEFVEEIPQIVLKKKSKKEMTPAKKEVAEGKTAKKVIAKINKKAVTPAKKKAVKKDEK